MSPSAHPEPRRETLVATELDEVVGYATVGTRREAAARHEDGELYNIYLRPQSWRRGIGSQLHGAALARLRDLGFGTATLWVLVGNERAMSFYRRAGWHADGGRRKVSGPGKVPCDELRFRHELAADRADRTAVARAYRTTRSSPP